MTDPPPRRRPGAVTAAEPVAAPSENRPRARTRDGPPIVLDFLPLEAETESRLSRFYVRLAEGRVATTRCRPQGHLHWPPRVACPVCHTEELDWIDLPERGRIYAHSAVLVGAPLGMEADVPFAVGLVDLDGVPLRLFGRIVGRPWEQLRIGDAVRLEPYPTGDGRWFYRFRAGE